MIWRAVGHLGGYIKHVSKTRNFGLDSNFNQIFTAGGGRPDMQFHYEKFDEIVEVTKMGNTNKSQLTGEFVKTKQQTTPVPTHVAEHKFRHGKNTNCIFIAPSIHSGSIHQCWLYSCHKTPVLVPGNYKQSKTYTVKVKMTIFGAAKINFHIVPLTLEQFLEIFLVCTKTKTPSKKWMQVLTRIIKTVFYNRVMNFWCNKKTIRFLGIIK